MEATVAVAGVTEEVVVITGAVAVTGVAVAATGKAGKAKISRQRCGASSNFLAMAAHQVTAGSQAMGALKGEACQVCQAMAACQVRAACRACGIRRKWEEAHQEATLVRTRRKRRKRRSELDLPRPHRPAHR